MTVLPAVCGNFLFLDTFFDSADTTTPSVSPEKIQHFLVDVWVLTFIVLCTKRGTTIPVSYYTGLEISGVMELIDTMPLPLAQIESNRKTFTWVF